MGAPHLVANWMHPSQLSHPYAHYALAWKRGISFHTGLTENSLVLIGSLSMPVTVGQRMGWDLLIELSAPVSDVGVVEGIGPQRKCREFFSEARGVNLEYLSFTAQ